MRTDPVPQPLRASALVPRGFVVEDATNEDGGALITVRSAAEVSACPGCGLQSGRVHTAVIAGAWRICRSRVALFA